MQKAGIRTLNGMELTLVTKKIKKNPTGKSHCIQPWWGQHFYHSRQTAEYSSANSSTELTAAHPNETSADGCPSVVSCLDTQTSNTVILLWYKNTDMHTTEWTLHTRAHISEPGELLHPQRYEQYSQVFSDWSLASQKYNYLLKRIMKQHRGFLLLPRSHHGFIILLTVKIHWKQKWQHRCW